MPINLGSISASNVTITAPTGVTAPTVSVANVNRANPNAVVVTYQFTVLGGWTAADNGLYTANMVANQVSDANSNFVPAGPLAPFFVAVPTTFTVTATSDTGTGSAGSGDLRYCITQANLVSPNPAIIVFSNSTAGGAVNFYDGTTHTISLGATALPSINNNLNITGPGASVLTITRPTSSTLNLVLVSPLAANDYRFTDTFSGFTLSGAKSSTAGAAIEDVNAVALTLNSVNIQNNSSSTSGTGFFNSTAGTSVTLNNCLVQSNTSTALGAGLDMGSTGQLTINNSTITANTAGNAGAGVFINGTQNLYLNVINSTISNNKGTGTSSNGAGIDVSATANFASVLIDHSTISGNSAAGTTGGGGFAFNGTVGAGGVTIQDSTIANNTAVNGGGIILGTSTGIFQGTVNIISSTITGNSATAAAGAAGTGGGGIALANATTTLGVYSTVNLDSSIVSGNNATGGFNDISATTTGTAIFVQSAYGALGTSTGYTLTDLGHNQIGATLNLQPLANNGGPTQTVALGSSSAAINAGDPVTTLTTDQRGYARVFGAAPDIGAYESQPFTVSSVVASDGIAADGTTQRSEVRQMVVTFSGPVTFTGGNVAAAFQLEHVQDSTNVTLAATTATNASGQTVVTLTFSGSETDPLSVQGSANAVPGPSLVDGRFQLTVLAANVNGPDGLALAGNGTTAGTDFVSPTDTLGGGAGELALYRLFGDATGNGIVDQLDLAQFRSANNSSLGNSGYVAYLDADNSGVIDQIDLGQFRAE